MLSVFFSKLNALREASVPGMDLISSKKSKFILIITITLFVNCFFAQKKDSWKREKKEIVFGLGASNFLGDLGGKDRIGTDYSPADIEPYLTSPSASLAYRYRLTKSIASRVEFSYLKLQGNDELTLEKFRNNRNLHFKSNIFELGYNIELSVSHRKVKGKYRNKKGYTKKHKVFKTNVFSKYYYATVGVGAFYFKPKGLYGDTWYDLRSLGTEGQGLPGGPKKYSRFSLSIPLGVGCRFRFNNEWTFGMEFNFRKTFTDYIDDTHGTYYNNNLIRENKGEIAAHFADPNLGNIPGATSPNSDGTGAQRGDKQMDSYMTLQIKLGYVLKQKRKHVRLKTKF